MNDKFWESFREEILATSMILVLMVFASFFLASRLFPDNNAEVSVEKEVEKRQDIARQIDDAMGLVMGDQVEEEDGDVLPKTESVAAAAPIPTISLTPMDTEVIYGQEGQYAFDDYELSFGNPRIAFNLNDGDSKKFVVNVTMKNVNVTQGIPTKLKAEIMKDGTIIVPEAVMTVTDSRILLPGESVDFQASISLIDGTDVGKLFYAATGVDDDIDHVVNPKMYNSDDDNE